MLYHSMLNVADSSSTSGNTAGDVSAPALLSLLGSWLVREVINRRSFAAKERLRGPIPGRCERGVPRLGSAKMLRSHARPLAEWRRRLRV